MNPNPIQATDHLPKTAASIAANQRMWQQTSNASFYSMLPAPYMSFYTNWVKQWLSWYDGYVSYIHGGQYGLLSTGIGTTIVNRCADQVFGGNIMFSNARKPIMREVTAEGKTVSKALDFISNQWINQVDGKTILKRCGKDALGGGFALVKLNKINGDLWIDELRADRFYIDKTASKIRKCVSVLSFYDSIAETNGDKYVLIEERRYEEIGSFGDEIPVIEYKMYKTSVPIQHFTSVQDNCIKWESLPKHIKKAFKSEYGNVMLNKPMALNGFTDLGVYLMLASDGVSSVPQIGLGESVLANILTYLYEYDFYNTCFNTDMYLARGRVLVPKSIQGPNARNGWQPSGLDEFIYTRYEAPNNDGNKPEAVQFALRSAEWKEARNILIESMATGIGMSVSTLASYISDGSNRTAREVSAEESATALFVENMRRRFEVPINDMLRAVLRFYGYVDDVEIRWTRSGMTNQTVLVDTLARAVQSGLISERKAHHAFNFDDDEEQNEEDYKLVITDRQSREAANSASIWGDVNENTEVSERGLPSNS